MNDPAPPTMIGRAAALCALTICLAGCESYKLRGMVVEGEEAQVLIVDPIDSRLNQYLPLAGATVELTLDPKSISPKKIGEFKTDHEGRFATTIDEMGAGFLVYDLGLLTGADGHRTLWEVKKLPPREKQLLIVLQPGKDTYKHPENLLEETQRIGEQLMR